MLLGREFKFAGTHVLRIWDCLFSAGAVDDRGKETEKADKEIVKVEDNTTLSYQAPDLTDRHSNDSSASSSSSDSASDCSSTYTNPHYLNDASQVLARGAVAVAGAGAGNPSPYPYPYPYPPMLVALREFMLAMLVHVSTVTQYCARTDNPSYFSFCGCICL